MFSEAYAMDTDAIKQKAKLLKEFIKLQKDIEIEEAKHTHEEMELKVRKM